MRRFTDGTLIKIALGTFFTLFILGGLIFAIKNSLFTPIDVINPMQDEHRLFPDIEIKNKPIQEIIKEKETMPDTEVEDVPVLNTTSWSNFGDEELGISFKYPPAASVSDCYTDDNCPPGVFNIISIQHPLNSSYDVWAYKSIQFSVSQGLCPLKKGSEVSHAGLTWFFESPNWVETSGSTSRNKVKIYTLEKGQVCFRVAERIYGPKDERFGVQTGSQPKNLEAFFIDEFKVLDQIFDSFVLEI